MIQAIYKGFEIEMEMHQQAHEEWKCDYTLIKHPEGTKTVHHGDKKFPTIDSAKEHALREARVEIDAMYSLNELHRAGTSGRSQT